MMGTDETVNGGVGVTETVRLVKGVLIWFQAPFVKVHFDLLKFFHVLFFVATTKAKSRA